MALTTLTRGSSETADFEAAAYNKRADFTLGYTITDARDVLLWPAYAGGDNNYYQWKGALPKVVPPSSTPAGTGGVSGSAWINVGDGADKSTVIPTAASFGCIADGDIYGNGTDNLANLNNAIANTTNGYLWLDSGYYIVSARPTNKKGVRFLGNGQICIRTTRTPGYANGSVSIHSYTRQYFLAHGLEHLYKAHQRIEQKGTLKCVLFGDSRVAGGDTPNVQARCAAVLANTMNAKGYPNCVFDNQGVGGTSVPVMNAIPFIDASVANSTDLFVIMYGTNDVKDVEDHYNQLSSKLYEIRQQPNGAWSKLSIVLMMPASTYDRDNQRDARWYEKLRDVYVELCDIYQCAFFDAYALMQDVSSAGGTLQDNPFGDGRGVHFLNTGSQILWGSLCHWMFPEETLINSRSNRFVNVPSVGGIPPAATGLPNYFDGLNGYRGTTAPDKAWPEEGAPLTYKHPDGVGMQLLPTFVAGSSKVLVRTWDTLGNTWNPWCGVVTPLTMQGTWVPYDNTGVTAGVPAVTKTMEGVATLSGWMKNGAITAGSALATLPVGFRPIKPVLAPIFMMGGVVGFIRINPTTGVITTETAGNATLMCLDGVSFPCA